VLDRKVLAFFFGGTMDKTLVKYHNSS
jgi:hypothetical protein